MKNRKKYTEFKFNNCYVVYIYEMFLLLLLYVYDNSAIPWPFLQRALSYFDLNYFSASLVLIGILSPLSIDIEFYVFIGPIKILVDPIETINSLLDVNFAVVSW